MKDLLKRNQNLCRLLPWEARAMEKLLEDMDFLKGAIRRL